MHHVLRSVWGPRFASLWLLALFVVPGYVVPTTPLEMPACECATIGLH